MSYRACSLWKTTTSTLPFEPVKHQFCVTIAAAIGLNKLLHNKGNLPPEACSTNTNPLEAKTVDPIKTEVPVLLPGIRPTKIKSNVPLTICILQKARHPFITVPRWDKPTSQIV